MAPTKVKLPKITAKQEDGDDGYCLINQERSACYVVRVDGKEFLNGLTRSELPHYKRQAFEYWMDRNNIPTVDRKELTDRMFKKK